LSPSLFQVYGAGKLQVQAGRHRGVDPGGKLYFHVFCFGWETRSKTPVLPGKRVKRGLFVFKEGLLIQAVVNRSFNIGQKTFGDE
jgi:hypothetical protein